MDQTVGVGWLERMDARSQQRAIRDNEWDDVDASAAEAAGHLLTLVESWAGVVGAIVLAVAVLRRRTSS